MTFRDPLTSADAVDTRGTAPAGVRMYETPNPDTNAPYGVIEWDDGYAANTPARIVQTAFPNPRSITDPIGRLAIKGGAYAPTSGAALTAPELDLGIEQDAAGNPVAQARLYGATTVLVQGTIAKATTDGTSRSTAPTFGAGWSAWPGTDYESLTFSQLPDGLIEVEGVCYYSGGTGASTKVCALAGAFRPIGGASARYGMLSGNLADTFRGVDVRPDGLYLRGALPGTTGTTQFLAINGVYRGANW